MEQENNTISLEQEICYRLLELVIFIAQMKPNKRTKEPSINIKQEDAVSMIQHIDSITSLLGYGIDIRPDEEKEGIVNISLRQLRTSEEEVVDA